MRKMIGKENVEIYLIEFKGDTNRIYAASLKGELLYERHLDASITGWVKITKEGATAVLKFTNGIRSSAARSTTLEEHGGSGFCQREKNEKFSDCFKAESEEFCDSFVSCIALATQPAVAILIGIACSCDAKTIKQ